MQAIICEGVDSLVNEICKYQVKENINFLLSDNFSDLFTPKGYKTFLAHLFTIPLPIRDKFVFFLIVGAENDGTKIIVAFGMLDNSSSSSSITTNTPAILKNVCRDKRYKWKGVGKHVLFALDRYAQQNYLEVVQLHTNDKLIPYYSKYGWKMENKIKDKVSMYKKY